MDGQAVFKLAVGVLESAARAVLEKAGRTEADLDWLIPHQANIRIMQGTAKKLKLPLDKLVVTVDEHGNTSAASVPLALDACGAQRPREARRHRHARRRGRRLHLGRRAARLLSLQRRIPPTRQETTLSHDMPAFAFVFPGQGSQSVGMLDAWGDHPRCAHARRSLGTRWA